MSNAHLFRGIGITTIFFKIPQKKRTQLKPIKPNFFTSSKPNFSPLHRRGFPLLFQRVPVFLKNLFLGSKPNFPTQRITATTCKRGTYNDFHPQTNKKNKPKTNPIQSQFQKRRNRSFRVIPKQKLKK
jgi:hypothetical protein